VIEQPSELEKRRRLLKLWWELDSIYRTSWLPTHEDIINFMQPNRGCFLPSDSNKGTRRDGEIVNDTAGDCLRKLAAAVDTGATSEAREFFTMGAEDPRLSESAAVREYLHEAQSVMFALIAKSNFHPANRNVIEDLVGPAIGLMLIMEDALRTFLCTHVPIGQYRAAADASGEVNTVARLYQYTAAQMADEFGLEKLSLGAQSSIRNLNTQVPYQVLHIIEPRMQRQYGKLDAKNKPWSSTWLEIGIGAPTATIPGGEPTDPFAPSSLLRESGFDEQPFSCPRWNQIGQDVYGKDSPGWTVLGDTKALQAMEIGSATAIARIYDPPLNVPEDLKNASLVPGAINPLPNNSRSKAEPTVMIPPEAVTVGQSERDRLERRINRGCYGDVLFMLSQDETLAKATAELIRGKKEERLLQLGGMFSRFADEHLRRSIGRMFAIAQRRGMLPPPPQELVRDGRIRIDFQNPLVVAQKAVGYSALKEILSLGIAVAQARAAGADKVNGDELMDTGAEMLGVKPAILKSDEELAQERQQAAMQAKAKAMGEAMTQAAPAIKDLSNADPEQLRQIAGMFGPAAVAQAAGNGA
jgi:hypothetical protein